MTQTFSRHQNVKILILDGVYSCLHTSLWSHKDKAAGFENNGDKIKIYPKVKHLFAWMILIINHWTISLFVTQRNNNILIPNIDSYIKMKWEDSSLPMISIDSCWPQPVLLIFCDCLFYLVEARLFRPGGLNKKNQNICHKESVFLRAGGWESAISRFSPSRA